MTSMATFSIRVATIGDCELILQFIRDLAEYEKLSHEVVATKEDLQSHLFGENPVAEVLIGEEDAMPVGFALFFRNFSTFLGRPGIYLEDLFVRPEFRGKGYGRALLVRLAQIAVERQYGRVEWAVLDWNQPAIDFYESLGARQLNEWIVNRVDGPKIEALASL